MSLLTLTPPVGDVLNGCSLTCNEDCTLGRMLLSRKRFSFYKQTSSVLGPLQQCHQFSITRYHLQGGSSDVVIWYHWTEWFQALQSWKQYNLCCCLHNRFELASEVKTDALTDRLVTKAQWTIHEGYWQKDLLLLLSTGASNPPKPMHIPPIYTEFLK